MNFSHEILKKRRLQRLSIPNRPKYLKTGYRQATVRLRPLRLVIITLFFSTAWTPAPAAEVADLIINHSKGHLLLSVNIRNVVTKEAGEPATDEVSSTIVYSIALYQVNNFWFDKKIVHQTATNTLKYDPLRKEYSLIRSWNGGPPMAFGALDQAGKLMSEIRDLKLIPLDGLEKGGNYQIRVQAVCQDQSAFIFGPTGCFKTDWYTVDFTF